MLAFLHIPLPPLQEKHVKADNVLELREQILNQRLLDSYYAQLRAENVAEFRRIRIADTVEQAE